MGKTVAISTADEQEIAEARGSNIPDMLYDVAAWATTTTVGQFVYKRIDNLLWTAEKTARWSLPQPAPVVATKSASAAEDSEDVGSNISGPPLIRPLPWLLFLPALIILRMVRSVLSVGTRVFGRGPVMPSAVVGFLQNKRRKLRALKYRGQRLQRIAKTEREAAGSNQTTWLERIILPLRKVICTRPYRTIDLNTDVAHAVVFRKDQKRIVSKKRNLNEREAESAEEQDDDASNEDSFEEAGCNALLDKYANEEDSSFNVEEVSSASSDSSLSEGDPTPKKANTLGKKDDKPRQQTQNGAQSAPGGKPDTLKRSSSENKNGVDALPAATKKDAPKTINVANRSKSAADLDNGNTQSTGVGADGKSSNTMNPSSTTPSKSIPNLSSSPENNENKPINQNIHSGPPTASVTTNTQIKSPPATILQPAATKQSPNATMSDVRHNFQHQKQPSQKQLQTSAATTAATASHQQQHQQQQQQQQFVSNGGKSRNKKVA